MTLAETSAATASESLHPVLSALVHELERERQQLLEVAHSIPVAHREIRPAADRWTAAENLSHLAVVEQSAGRLFSVHARQLREAGAPADTTSDATEVIAAFARFSVHLRNQRLQAPDRVAPVADASFDEALSQLAETRVRLLEAIHKANGLPLGTVTAPHPRLGEITLYEWLLMIARHEARHTGQLQELMAQLSTPDAPSSSPTHL